MGVRTRDSRCSWNIYCCLLLEASPVDDDNQPPNCSGMRRFSWNELYFQGVQGGGKDLSVIRNAGESTIVQLRMFGVVNILKVQCQWKLTAYIRCTNSLEYRGALGDSINLTWRYKKMTNWRLQNCSVGHPTYSSPCRINSRRIFICKWWSDLFDAKAF